MSDLVRNPEDRFSRDAAQIKSEQQNAREIYCEKTLGKHL